MRRCGDVLVGFGGEAVGGDDGLHGVAEFAEGVGVGLQGGLERGTGEDAGVKFIKRKSLHWHPLGCKQSGRCCGGQNIL